VHRALLAAILVCTCLSAPAIATATETVSLHATLTPEQLGRGTTVGFGFQIATPDGKVPPPLTAARVLYPGTIGVALSGLGLDPCLPADLKTFGRAGCPPDSLMGYGTALAEIAIGPEILQETVQVEIFAGTESNGHLALLIYATGQSPVDAQVVFPGLLLPAPQPFGGQVDATIPLVPSLPEAPNVSVVRFNSTLGPQHITYYEHIHGRTVAYHPKGLLLPNTCPPGGFPFAAELSFEDGSHATARTTVPCPRG
jgi:hypothetical protein